MPPTHDLYTGGGAVPAISADGRTLFYIGISTTGGRNFYRRQLDQLDAVVVPGVEGRIQHPFLSPDGRGLGFMVTGRAVRRIDLAGGPVATVSDTLQGSNGGTCLADNTIVFSGESPGVRRRLFRVSAAGGVPTALTNPNGSPGVIHVYPQVAPGGAVVAFTAWSGLLASARVAVRSLETGEEKVLLEGTSPWILSTGHLVYAREGSLWAVPFDADRLQTTGEARRVVENVQVNSGGLALFAVSGNGTLVYVPGSSGTQRTLVWVDRQGREAPLAIPPRGYSSARVSPDGTHVALDNDNASGKDVWIWDETRAVLARFTSGGAVDGAPEWTPNGRRIVFSSTRGGSAGLFSQDADGTGVPERLVAGTSAQVPYSFTPDGTRLILQGQDTSAQASLALLTLDGSRRVAPLMSAGAGQLNAALSADGAWIAYQSNESGQSEIYVRPFPRINDGRWQVSTGGGTRPAWTRGGRELVSMDGATHLTAVPVETAGSTFRAGTPATLFTTTYAPPPAWRTYDVSPDGQRFLMIKEGVGGTANAPPPSLVVVLNWFEELTRLVPPK